MDKNKRYPEKRITNIFNKNYYLKFSCQEMFSIPNVFVGLFSKFLSYENSVSLWTNQKKLIPVIYTSCRIYRNYNMP